MDVDDRGSLGSLRAGVVAEKQVGDDVGAELVVGACVAVAFALPGERVDAGVASGGDLGSHRGHDAGLAVLAVLQGDLASLVGLPGALNPTGGIDLVDQSTHRPHQVVRQPHGLGGGGKFVGQQRVHLAGMRVGQHAGHVNNTRGGVVLDLPVVHQRQQSRHPRNK
ncbi:hypothetical protein [Saccharomonospora sp. CUA-673]|uniref:hypothetical protein n=1 Tax=Saccharomonospora sp. CUA-673 TaxID=1904969 RepID=UPI0011152A42|nr:hypothetical protein [Saccharomonospora sp. CUA-673]